MKNFKVENSSIHVVALIKFEQDEWGVRYKTLTFEDDQWGEDDLKDYANKERVGGESVTITVKVFDLKENKILNEIEVEVWWKKF